MELTEAANVSELSITQVLDQAEKNHQEDMARARRLLVVKVLVAIAILLLVALIFASF